MVKEKRLHPLEGEYIVYSLDSDTRGGDPALIVFLFSGKQMNLIYPSSNGKSYSLSEVIEKNGIKRMYSVWCHEDPEDKSEGWFERYPSENGLSRKCFPIENGEKHFLASLGINILPYGEM